MSSLVSVFGVKSGLIAEFGAELGVVFAAFDVFVSVCVLIVSPVVPVLVLVPVCLPSCVVSVVSLVMLVFGVDFAAFAGICAELGVVFAAFEIFFSEKCLFCPFLNFPSVFVFLVGFAFPACLPLFLCRFWCFPSCVGKFGCFWWF